MKNNEFTDWALTSSLFGADAWSLQIWGLDEDGGSVQSIWRESIKAVLRHAGGDGDLVLSFSGGYRGRKMDAITPPLIKLDINRNKNSLYYFERNLVPFEIGGLDHLCHT